MFEDDSERVAGGWSDADPNPSLPADFFGDPEPWPPMDAGEGSMPPYSPGRCRPSGVLAWELDLVTDDPGRMSDHDLVDAAVAWDRVSSWAAARQVHVLAEFARRRPGDHPGAVMSESPGATSPYAPDEIGLALHLSRGTAKMRLGQASQLAQVLPATLAAWEQGLLDGGKVRAICEAVGNVSAQTAAAIESLVLPRAAGQTVAQLRAALRRAIIKADPDGAAQRHEEARRDRRVVLGVEQEGMASLWALLAAPDAVASYEWLSRIARSLGKEDPRPMDARRADLLVDLLTGRLTFVSETTDNDVTVEDPLDPCPAGSQPADPCWTDPDPAGPDPAGPDPAGPNPAGPNPAGPNLAGPGCGTGRGPRPGDADLTESDLVSLSLVDDGLVDHGSLVPESDGREPASLVPSSTGCAPASVVPRSTGCGPEPAAPDPAERGLTDEEQRAAGGTALPTITDPLRPDSMRPAIGRADPRRGTLRPPAPPGKPLIHIVMSFSTLTGADDDPCELTGYGPIPAELARRTAADGVWKRLLTDPASGALLDHGRTTYRPPAALADHVRARDVKCRSPICRRRAQSCELDHTIAWVDGGTTSEHNLYAGCVHDHHLKHAPGWTVIQHPDDRIEWITPTGHRYFSDPYDYRPEPPLGPLTATANEPGPAPDNPATVVSDAPESRARPDHEIDYFAKLSATPDAAPPDGDDTCPF